MIKRRKHTEETRKKISESRKGCRHSEETKRKMSDSRRGENSYFFGKKHSDESKIKMSESHKSSLSKKKYIKSNPSHLFQKGKGLGNKNGFKKGNMPWSYIDGRSKFISPARYGSNWKKIRTRILIRDDYTCQDCGIHKSRVRFIDVHHKIPFLKSFDNSEENLVALCRKCHALAEREVN